MSETIIPLRLYIWVFVWLMVLLALTVAGAYLPMHGREWTIAYTIAFIKALLVILYFMHVRYSPRLVWVFAAAAFLWLGIMFTLTFSDYFTRGWLPTAEIISPEHPTRIAPPGFAEP